MKQLILTQLLPPLFDFIIVALLSAISALFYRLSGIQIDAKHRDTLQSALANGAKLLLQPGGSADQAIDYVLRSVPDALKRFGKTSRSDIEKLLEPHILALPTLPGIADIPSEYVKVAISQMNDPKHVQQAIDAGVAKGLDAVKNGRLRSEYGSQSELPVPLSDPKRDEL